MQWKIEPKSENVHILRVEDPHIQRSDWQFRMLITGDRHFDSPSSDRALQRRHLEQAQAGGWPVLDVGDFFDLMQGRHDPRQSKRDLLAQYADRLDYYDAVIEDAAAFFAPFAANLTVIGRGNHEAKVLKHEGTDVLKRFCYRLTKESQSTVYPGGYGGWLVVKFTSGNFRCGANVKYYHGSGGGGPVTRGVIQTNRRAVFLPDADVIVSGHVHEAWAVTTTQERINTHGRVSLRDQLHVCVPTYKEEYHAGEAGWHVERGAPPKPIGAYWLIFSLVGRQSSHGTRTYDMRVRALRAD